MNAPRATKEAHVSSGWMPDSSFREKVQELRKLREGERRGAAISQRTAFVLSLLISSPGTQSFVLRERSQGAPYTLFADADGLRLDLGLENADGIHSHVPYTFLTEEMIAYLETSNLLSGEDAVRDLRIRVAEARGEHERAETLAHEAEEALLVNTGAESLQTLIRDNPERLKESYLPAPSLRSLLEREPSAETVMTLLHLASNANGGNGSDALTKVGDALPGVRERSRFTRNVFSERAASLHRNPRNAEAAKILEVLLEQHNVASFEHLGIEAMRGRYAGGREFIALYTGTRYERVLLDPSKHIRGTKARANYATIPLVENTDFEAVEGLLLPYLHLNALLASLEDGQERDGVHIREALNALASELAPMDYEPLFTAGKAYIHTLTHAVDSEVREQFREQVTSVLSRYGKRFIGQSPKNILDTYLKLPERTEIVYDQSFIDSAPEDMQEKIAEYLGTLPKKKLRTTVMRSSTEHGVPFALEGRALRALHIEARPTLVLVTGAKFENVEDQGELIAIADALMSVGIETGANIFMQGTQSGRISEVIVRAYWEYRTNLPEGTEPAFRLFAIEPGKSVYAGPLGYPNDSLQGPSPLLPIDAILTPYPAGWSPGQSMHTYLPHVVLRQAIIRHAADGHSAATLVINGGGWSIPECVESAGDGFPHVVIPDSGRLALLLAHLAETRSTWISGGVEAALEQLTEFVGTQAGTTRTQLEQDLVLMQERGLQELIEHLGEGLPVHSANARSLAQTLTKLLKEPKVP